MCLCAALVLASPSFSHAQYQNPDRQNPKEYVDEDSQPLVIASYALYPIGFAVEWLVARPLHYVTAETPVAPIFEPADSAEDRPPPILPIYPDNTLAEEPEEEMPPQEIIIRPGAPEQKIPFKPEDQRSAPATLPKSAQKPASQPALQ